MRAIRYKKRVTPLDKARAEACARYILTHVQRNKQGILLPHYRGDLVNLFAAAELLAYAVTEDA